MTMLQDNDADPRPDRMTEDLTDSLQFADNPEPRCACVLVVDTSGSMAGQAIEELNSGLKHFKECLTADTLASLRTEIAVVSYNHSPTVVHDFTTVDLFDPPQLTARGGTVMSTAMDQALQMVEERKQTYRDNQITYYRPWIWIICDGKPEHDPPGAFEAARERIHQAETDRLAAVYVVGVQGADMSVLNTITQRTEALMLRSLDFRSMFEWLASSMSSVSQSQPSEAVPLDSPEGWGRVPE